MRSSDHKKRPVSSSSSASASAPLVQARNPRTMEEVWKHIHPPSSDLHDDPHLTNFRAINLQDFLAQPFSHNPPTTNLPARYAPPATFLSLNSGPGGFHFEPQSQVVPISKVSSSFNANAPGSGKKRFPFLDENTGGGDRRHRRMIKNRESAARSRDKKQAYTNKLELEVASLMKENARLKKQQQQLCAAAAVQLPKKHTLHRTSTAPF